MARPKRISIAEYVDWREGSPGAAFSPVKSTAHFYVAVAKSETPETPDVVSVVYHADDQEYLYLGSSEDVLKEHARPWHPAP